MTHEHEQKAQPDQIDTHALRAYRYARVQQQLIENDCSAVLLIDPVNIRYATDTRNMTVWLFHNSGRWCLVPAEGKAILFDYAERNCKYAFTPAQMVRENRPALNTYTFAEVGESVNRVALEWAQDMDRFVCELMGPGPHRLAVDKMDLIGGDALRQCGFTVVDGQRLLERARLIKSKEEIACLRRAVDVAEIGLERIRNALRPGISENELWAELHYANIANDGEWIETRLLSSGPRTNPWYQECSTRRIEAGDLVAVDTDLVGPYGYMADVSRTFFCAPGTPTPLQKEIYALAAEQVRHNASLLRHGTTFHEVSQRAWKPPARYAELQYGSLAHGVGMGLEWPNLFSDTSWEHFVDRPIVAGMVLSVESYIGAVGDPAGVKMEDQVLVTENGYEVMSRFPLESQLL